MLNERVSKFINKLVREYPAIKEIWLFGSRANNESTSNSDWDFLIFANKDVYSSLKCNNNFNVSDIDLLVVINNDGDFLSPFDDKSGNLLEWEWKTISSNEAIYKSVKGTKAEKISWSDDDEPTQYFNIIKRTLKALKI